MPTKRMLLLHLSEAQAQLRAAIAERDAARAALAEAVSWLKTAYNPADVTRTTEWQRLNAAASLHGEDTR